MSVRLGVRLAVDVGTVRIGVAVSDPDCILATPVTTVAHVDGDDSDLKAVAKLVAEYDAVELVVGLPLHMSGKEGASAEMARSWADRLEPMLDGIPITFVDERLTTVVATRTLHSTGRKTKSHKPVIDQAAATALLQGHLDRVRSSS